MYINRSWNGAASISHQLNVNYSCKYSWTLRWKPVCASTEIDLTKWLLDIPFSHDKPRAVFAARQNYGKGQLGRVWESKLGGVWLSSAIPSQNNIKSPQLLGLSIALALIESLEKYNVPVKLKWPNDLIVYNKKLAGFLPRVIYRGEQVRFYRVGLGLNVRNNVPFNGISLMEILGDQYSLFKNWSAQSIIALERALENFR